MIRSTRGRTDLSLEPVRALRRIGGSVGRLVGRIAPQRPADRDIQLRGGHGHAIVILHGMSLSVTLIFISSLIVSVVCWNDVAFVWPLTLST